ncbi:uncharacterized protein LOC106868431 [Octopus bimaculoides]|uniref:uncharacterized protein LOC106868431 n=1 Tax=Octopus bimaculoides TaxID=37653 RepID=UPI0022E4F54C|nr:uncharacterized protein LOC106868431 [Octopus bimaculoides]
MSNNNYRCINCGTRVKDLFHKLSSGLLTCVCSNCNEVVDKYIEHDSVLIFLDALLLKTQAFRHILHNRSRKTVWKITLTFLLIETLARVINSSKVISKWNNPDAEFYTILVTEFLYMFVEVALEQITGVLVIVFLSKMYSDLVKIPHPGMKPLLTGLFFSYFLCNVFIPLVSLWGENYREKNLRFKLFKNKDFLFESNLLLCTYKALVDSGDQAFNTTNEEDNLKNYNLMIKS